MPVDQIRMPAFRPRLPSAERLLPYLSSMDDSARYTNHGPLALSLQARLEKQFGLAEGTSVATASGTAALMAGILAQAGRAKSDRPYALCPAYTFVATALAVECCGYTPYLADTASLCGGLEPQHLYDHPALDRLGLVVPVCIYGRPVDMAAWAAFQQRTGIPVVVDAAAAFEAVFDGRLRPCGNIPLALSFHATKAFACGEGSCVLSADVDVSFRAAQAIGFGFMGTRNCAMPGFNGKMSEYHAAVGLAELDGWDAKREGFRCAADLYRLACVEAGLSADDIIAAPDILLRITSCIGLVVQNTRKSCAELYWRRGLNLGCGMAWVCTGTGIFATVRVIP